MEEETHGWIRLEGLHVDGVRVGIHPHEKEGLQSVVVDVALWVPVRHAADSEKLEDAVDYDTIAELVRNLSRQRHYPLLESLCEKMAAALLEQPHVGRVIVETAKPGALAPGSVSVTVERSQ
jgi:dihydroneopterin aldolase